jgi:Sec-independent protein translocase protein TatA
LIVFGSAKFSRTARDLGQLLGGTKRTVEEAKSDLIPEEVKEARDAIKDLKSEALPASGEGRDSNPRRWDYRRDDLQEEGRRTRPLCHLSHLEDTLFTRVRGIRILRTSP